MKDVPNVGGEPPGDARRDAIHVAVCPMVATRELLPGERLKSGIVDPYRVGTVTPGERYWLFLYPNTVTSLRHVWTHPEFPEEV